MFGTICLFADGNGVVGVAPFPQTFKSPSSNSTFIRAMAWARFEQATKQPEKCVEILYGFQIFAFCVENS